MSSPPVPGSSARQPGMVVREAITVSATTSAPAAGPITVEVVVRVKPGWKIFGEGATTGLPTVFSVPPGWRLDAVSGPEGEVTSTGVFELQTSGPTGLAEIAMTYQPCSGNVCHRPVTISLPLPDVAP